MKRNNVARGLRLTVVVALLVALAIAASVVSVSADSSYNSHQWSSWIAHWGSGWEYWSGSYYGNATWTSDQGSNYFTRFDSVSTVDNYSTHPYIGSSGTQMDVYHGGVLAFSITTGDWQYCDYVRPTDSYQIGGCTTSFNWTFSDPPGAQSVASWSFQACDEQGCYGGYGENNIAWTLW